MNMTPGIFGSLLLITVSLVQAEEAAAPSKTETKTETTAEVVTPSTKKKEEEQMKGIKRGKKLHDAHCISCHDSQLYTSKNRKISNYESLKTHVQTCATNLNKQWFEDEVADVAAYLNAEFYLFETQKAKTE